MGKDVAIYIYKDESSSPATKENTGSVDVGCPLLPGNAAEIDGKLHISAAGNDIWGTKDQFHYVQQSATATDLTLKVHILSVDGTHEWTKVGLMIRETLDDNSVNLACVQTLRRGVAFQYRTQTGGN